MPREYYENISQGRSSIRIMLQVKTLTGNFSSERTPKECWTIVHVRSSQCQGAIYAVVTIW